MKKSYQSEISALLFHPNISKTSVHAMESIVQISVDFLVSGTQYKHAIDQHLFLFNQQKLLTGDLNRRILCSPGICVISFAFISNITVYIFPLIFVLEISDVQFSMNTRVYLFQYCNTK